MLRGGTRRVTLVTLVAIGIPRAAIAAPDDGHPLSNDAALRGGAAIVLGRDAASLWYNPASIAGTRRLRFDASVSAYGLRMLRTPSSLQAAVDGDTRRVTGKHNQVLVIPSGSAFAYGFPQHRLAIALSFHVPQRSDTRTRLDLAGRSEAGGYDFVQAATVDRDISRYHFGSTVAWAPVDALRLGATIGGIYDSRSGFVRFVADARSDTTPALASYVGDVDSATQAVALEGVLGLQGELTRWLYAGATVRLPARTVWHAGEGAETLSTTFVDATGGFANEARVVDVRSSPPKWLTPWLVGGGLAVRLRRVDFEVDATASTAVNGGDGQYRQRGQWNLRMGGTLALAPSWRLGAGLFTDRSTLPEGDLYPSVVVDRWGASLGLRMSTRVQLADREHADDMILETTIAAQYAGGLGRSRALGVVYPDEGPERTTLDLTRETVARDHVVTLQVGSGLRF